MDKPGGDNGGHFGEPADTAEGDNTSDSTVVERDDGRSEEIPQAVTTAIEQAQSEGIASGVVDGDETEQPRWTSDVPEPDDSDDFITWIQDNAFVGQRLEVATESGQQFTVEVIEVDAGSQSDIRIDQLDGDEYLGSSRKLGKAYMRNANDALTIRRAENYSALDLEQQREAVRKQFNTGVRVEQMPLETEEKFREHTREEVVDQFKDPELLRSTIHSLYLVRNEVGRASCRGHGSASIRVREDENPDTINHEYAHAVLTARHYNYVTVGEAGDYGYTEAEYERRPRNVSNEHSDKFKNDDGYIDFDFSDDSDWPQASDFMLRKGRDQSDDPVGYDSWGEFVRMRVQEVEHPDLRSRDYTPLDNDETARDAVERMEPGDAATLHTYRREDQEEPNTVHVILDERKHDEDGQLVGVNFEKEGGGTWEWSFDENGDLASTHGSYLASVDTTRSDDEVDGDLTVGDREAETAVGQFRGMIDNPETAEDRLYNLVNAVNRSWYKQAKTMEEANTGYKSAFDATDTTIGSSYSATNAHETFAKFHEQMQFEANEAWQLERIVEQHPWLTAAYVEVFEPHKSARDVINENERMQELGIKA